MNAIFGSKSIQTLANCAALSEGVGVALSPALVFFSALALIDPAGMVLAADTRDTALKLTARYLLAEPGQSEGPEQQIARLFAEVGAQTQGVVSPFDLLIASAAVAADAIDAGLARSGSSAPSVIELIRERFSEDALGDEAASPPVDAVFKFAVVIEGPGFCDERNRYPTLEVAQRAVKAFDQLSRGESITHDRAGEGFFMIDPPRLKEATRIYVREL
jgi:hypothetical protein